MSTISTFEHMRAGSAMSARLRWLGGTFCRFGAAFMRALHEQRRRQAARMLTHERYLAALDRAAQHDGDARPRIVPLRPRRPEI